MYTIYLSIGDLTMCTVAAAIQVAASGHSGWMCQSNVPTIPVCSWSGVSCFQSSVTDISLYKYSVQGSLPSTLGLLSTITYLALSYNRLIGPIASTLGLLSNLNALSLYYNSLTGPIPSTLCSDKKLTLLYLDYNNLQCYPACLTSIPTFYTDNIPQC